MEIGLVCSECGDEPARSDLPTCFTCSFWQEKILLQQADPEHWFSADGSSFHIAAENAALRLRGFGGARVLVEFRNGDRVVSTNLWTQGRIPERFRGRLPDTAVLRWLA